MRGAAVRGARAAGALCPGGGQVMMVMMMLMMLMMLLVMMTMAQPRSEASTGRRDCGLILANALS